MPRRLGSSLSPVFVDASAWLASANNRDQHHHAAQTVLEACFRDHVHLVTTNWTAYEAISMVKSRAGAQVTAGLWELLTDAAAVDLVRISEDVENRALGLFFSHRDKKWGVVDCASLVVMEDLGCRLAFGFDRHFTEASRQRGFEVLDNLT